MVLIHISLFSKDTQCEASSRKKAEEKIKTDLCKWNIKHHKTCDKIMSADNINLE